MYTHHICVHTLPQQHKARGDTHTCTCVHACMRVQAHVHLRTHTMYTCSNRHMLLGPEVTAFTWPSGAGPGSCPSDSGRPSLPSCSLSLLSFLFPDVGDSYGQLARCSQHHRLLRNWKAERVGTTLRCPCDTVQPQADERTLTDEVTRSPGCPCSRV